MFGQRKAKQIYDQKNSFNLNVWQKKKKKKKVILRGRKMARYLRDKMSRILWNYKQEQKVAICVNKPAKISLYVSLLLHELLIHYMVMQSAKYFKTRLITV